MMFKICRFAFIFLISKLGMNSTLSLADDKQLGYHNGIYTLSTDLKAGYESNLYDSSLVKRSSFYYQPSISLLADIKKKTYGFQGRYGYELFFPDNKQDAAQSHSVDMNSYWSPSPSNLLFLSTAIKKEDEQRGTGLTSDALDLESKLDSFSYGSIAGRYAFERSNQRSLTFSLGYALDQKIYQSNRELAYNANLERKKLTLNLGYKWTRDRKIYLESKRIKQNYPNLIDESKNSENQISAAGLTWPLTPISDISISYGKEKKLFDIENRPIITNYWSSLVSWSPLSYTELSLASRNEQKPATKKNQTLDESRNLTLNWKYIRSAHHNIIFSVTKKRKKEIIEGISKKEIEKSFSIINSYLDLDLALTLKNNKNRNRNKSSEVSISMNYNFKKAL